MEGTPSLIYYKLSPQDDTFLQELLIDRDKLLDQLQRNIHTSQHFMKQYAYHKR